MTPEALQQIADSEKKVNQEQPCRIGVCTAAGCMSCKSGEVLKSLKGALERRPDLPYKAQGVGCMGLCAEGPLVTVQPENELYKKITPDDVPALVESLGQKPWEEKRCDQSAPFFKRQVKVVLEDFENIQPERIESYMAYDGYEALVSTVTHKSPADVLDEITRSGLRGRGGGGYPTGLKWSTVAKAHGAQKYVICNADEGDPGAFMDRSVLECAPHRVLEGMAIAAYAIGASFGYLYVRAEYPLAVKRLKLAIKQAEKMGLLGDHICGTAFTFKVDIRLGAGAFVCGEETALIASIEGRRGQPRPRPPYPAVKGLWGCPTLINNVETLANIPTILRKGADWYASMGTESSNGTKVFALAGRIQNTGLIEVPMGISLREIVEEMGGGAPEGRTIKAVQTGGPSGGCIPADRFDLSVDYESLQKIGSIMGSGGMIVMDETSSMVDVARFFMDFCKYESCGKCAPCRIGTTQMYNLLDRIRNRKACKASLAQLERLCEMVQTTSLCGLGMTAPNPVLSTLKFFRHEYEELLLDECPTPDVEEVS
ncbi:MAG: NADH-quinone oxidoreductase subunit NuoF [Kiritimatiellae bacterium]|nr:NADH-quinone oxidoreductase subunit NuoF [Kiritimatiellia bacterium]